MTMMFGISPVADWIEPRSIDPDDSNTPDTPSVFLLVDYQTRVEDEQFWHFRRTVQRINDATRIEGASQHLYEIDPDSERVVFHSCTIIRGEQRIDALDPENIQAVQRERSLEQHVSSNRMTVVLTIDDLREGDILDLAVTEHEFAGEHPLRARYLRSTFWTSWGVPISCQRVRVINDSSRPLDMHDLDTGAGKDLHSLLAPGEEAHRDWLDLTPERTGDNLPNWYWPGCCVCTTASDWPAVSRYLHNYYVASDVLDDDLDVSGIDGVDWSDGSAENLMKVIRFVQDDVRYRSETHGVWSHTPRKPSRTLKKRKGDCKDKSNLLVTLLARLGIRARLALVNSDYRGSVAQFHPSPLLFDHMIVCVDWQGQSVFVDPTIQKQGGTLETAAHLEFGQALVLDELGCELSAIDNPIDRPVFQMTYQFDLTDLANRAPTVCVRREYRQARADNMRYYFDAHDRNLLEQNYQQATAEELEVTIDPIQPIHVVSDDRIENVLVTEESYRITTPAADISDNALHVVSDIFRTMEVSSQNGFPVALQLDGIVEHEVRVRYDKPLETASDSLSVSNKAFTYHDAVSVDGNDLVFNTRIEPLGREVSAEDLEQHREDVEKMRHRSGSRFLVRVGKTHRNRDHLAYLAPLGLVCFYVFTRSRNIEVGPLPYAIVALGTAWLLFAEDIGSRWFSGKA